ncbi:zinc fingers and homeoboxes protein 3 isoform X1 [Lates japonicus]|uniref:Zinc fingers and homeoboxes protein 3 isoform X1 n=1 Tax=Lates japonicus TaxID=270547 RepID=A0AAD3QVV9_LATJO|nr:zinc fingers and homeoboxes protein 3 isoform X1 [Lates japonicus]
MSDSLLLSARRSSSSHANSTVSDVCVTCPSLPSFLAPLSPYHCKLFKSCAAYTELRQSEVFPQNCSENCKWTYGQVPPSSFPHAWSIVNRKRLIFSLTPPSAI